MNRSLWELILVQVRDFIREPATIFWAVIFPIMLAAVLGLAFLNQGESEQLVAVVGEKMPENLNEKIHQGFQFRLMSEEEAAQALKRGKISLILRQKGDSLEYHFDPGNSEARMNYLMLQNQRFEAKIDLPDRVQEITTTGNRYIDFLIPGLIALGIMNGCLWGVSWTLIEYRIKKLLRRMVATDVSGRDDGFFRHRHITFLPRHQNSGRQWADQRGFSPDDHCIRNIFQLSEFSGMGGKNYRCATADDAGQRHPPGVYRGSDGSRCLWLFDRVVGDWAG